jgi:serine/threonine-protein kinase SRPK3
VILGCKWGSAADIWSLGCIVSCTYQPSGLWKVFEMLTGMTLFRPPLDENSSVSEGQLLMMVDLLGEFPKEMLLEGKNAHKYFDQHGMSGRPLSSSPGNFTNCPDVVPSGSSLKRMFEIFKEKSKYQIDLPTEEITDVVDLLYRMWTLSPTERPTAKYLLEHRWFQSVDV